MSLVVSNSNFHSNTAAYKSFYYGWAEDTVNTCHLVVRCDATINGPVTITGDLQATNITATDTLDTCHLVVTCDADITGPVDITGDVSINGNLDVSGNITGNIVVVPDYTVTYKTSNFTIPNTLATTFNVYQVDTSTGPITVTLPAIATLDAGKKRQIDIVDVGGKLSINPLTINTVGTDTIAGDTSVQVLVDYSALHLISNADVAPAPPTGKWLIA